MIDQINLTNILFLDIETVPQHAFYDTVPENIKLLWDKKSGFYRKHEESAEEFYQKSGIWAEFGKVICVSVAKFLPNGKLRVKSIYGDDEKEVLIKLSALLNRQPAESFLCAHNGKEFDFPYLCRRMLIHKLPIPGILNITRKRPWESNLLDTLELWKFGDYKNYTSLELLAVIFGVPTPKDDIDGSQVAHVYYQEKDLAKIVRYCEKDVLTLARVLQCLKGADFVKDEDIIAVTE